METNKLSPEEQALVEAAKPVGKPTGDQNKVAGRIGPRVDDAEAGDAGKPQEKKAPEARKPKKKAAKKEKPEASRKETSEAEPKRGRPRKEPEKKPEPAPAEAEDVGEIVLVTDSFKLKKNIQDRLLRASFERKVSKSAPYTKQAIVNEALDAWLVENGF